MSLPLLRIRGSEEKNRFVAWKYYSEWLSVENKNSVNHTIPRSIRNAVKLIRLSY